MLYLQQRDYVSALQLFKDLSDADPSLGGPQYVQGIRAYYAGNRQQSLKYFEQSLAVLNQEYIAFSDEPSGRFVIDQLRLALNSLCGEIYLEEKKYKQALQYFSRAQKYDHKSIILDSRLKIAALLLQAEREPQNAGLYAAVGYYYGLLNQDIWAAQYYERSLQLLPRSAEASLGLAIAYRHLRLYDKAYVNLTQALQYSKDKKIISAVYLELGNYYIETKKFSEAASVLAKAEVLDPENIAAQTDARYVQALLAYTRAPRSVTANLILGQECLARQDYEQALARLRYVESMAPQNILGLLALARTHYALGDRQRARIYYERTLKIAPEETSVLFGYVDVLVADEDHTQAVSFIQKILKKDPNNVLVRNKLAAVYFAAGQNKNAIHEWRFVLEHINNPEMTTVIKNIIEVIG
jgi:tetratricopeptide (TPR) repeat protein